MRLSIAPRSRGEPAQMTSQPSSVITITSSMRQRYGRGEIEEAGMRTSISRPVRQRALVRALRMALGHEPPGAPLPSSKDVSDEDGYLFAGSRVLLVEDKLVNQKVASIMLKRLDLTVTVAGNGQEAVEAIEELAPGEAFDVILMDCQMPIMDSHEATRVIRAKDGRGEHQLIIAMIANAMEGDRQTCLNAGMDDYISKPVRRETMVETLNRWLVQEPSDESMWTVQRLSLASRS